VSPAKRNTNNNSKPKPRKKYFLKGIKRKIFQKKSFHCRRSTTQKKNYRHTQQQFLSPKVVQEKKKIEREKKKTVKKITLYFVVFLK
jgi:hypothetical protein